MKPGLAGIFSLLLDRAIDGMDESELDQVEHLRAEAETLASDLALTAGGLAAIASQEQGAKDLVESRGLAPAFFVITHVAESIVAMLGAVEAAEDVRLRRQRIASAQVHSPGLTRRARPKAQVPAIAEGGAA